MRAFVTYIEYVRLPINVLLCLLSFTNCNPMNTLVAFVDPGLMLGGLSIGHNIADVEGLEWDRNIGGNPRRLGYWVTALVIIPGLSQFTSVR